MHSRRAAEIRRGNENGVGQKQCRFGAQRNDWDGSDSIKRIILTRGRGADLVEYKMRFIWVG